MDTAHYWDDALRLDDYVGQMWRKNRRIFAKNRERTVLDDATRDRFGFWC